MSERIAWGARFDAAVAEAARRRALALVFLAAPGRPAARAMEDETFAHPDVVRAARPFVCVRLDAEAEAALHERLIGGRGALGTAVVDGTADVVTALAGWTAPEVMAAALEGARAGWPRLAEARRRAAARPEDLAAQMALARAYEALGSGRRAEETWGAVLARAGGGVAGRLARVAAHERLARALVGRGRNREAREHLAAFRSAGGSDPRALFTEALVLTVERRLREGLDMVARARAADPAGPDADHALFVEGLLRHELGDDPAALAVLERLRREHGRSRWARLAADQIQHIRDPGADHQH